MTRMLLLMAAAGLSAAFSMGEGDGTDAAPVEVAQPTAPELRVPKIEVYRLGRAGRDKDCSIARGEQIDGRTAMLAVEERCGDLHAALIEAKRWRDLDDGTVVLATSEGEPIARFSPGDGIAYESFEPAAPILYLRQAR